MHEEQRQMLVKLRFLGTAFCPEEERIQVAVLRGDGTVARLVDKWPMVVELDAQPGTVIPIQILMEADQSLHSTIHLPLAQVMKGVGTPAFCTLWLADSSEEVESAPQSFIDALARGQDLTHPKLGVGVRIVDASDPTGTSNGVERQASKSRGRPAARPVSPAAMISSTSPLSPPGMFRVVDMYEDVLAAVYQKAETAVQTMTNALKSPIRQQLQLEMQESKDQLCKQMQHVEAESNRKVCSVLSQLATKQRQVNRLQSEVQALKVSRKQPRGQRRTGETSPAATPKNGEEQPVTESSVAEQVADVTDSVEIAQTVAALPKQALESSPAADSTSCGGPGFCTGCAKLQLELAEARRRAHALACELEDAQQAAGHRVELQARRAVCAMRQIQEKAQEYEEDMRKRDTQVLALHEDLQKAKREAAHRAQSAILAQAEVEAYRKELGRRPSDLRSQAAGIHTPTQSRPASAKGSPSRQRVPSPILQGRRGKEEALGSPPRSPVQSAQQLTATRAGSTTSAVVPALSTQIRRSGTLASSSDRRPRSGGRTVARQRSGGLTATTPGRSRPKVAATVNTGNRAQGVSRSPSPPVARLHAPQSSPAFTSASRLATHDPRARTSSGAQDPLLHQLLSRVEPTATVGLDLTNNGNAEIYVTGVDRNRDGIPDVLQAPLTTVGVDTNHDGRANLYVTGTDLAGDGIPDILEQAPPEGYALPMSLRQFRSPPEGYS